MLECPYCKCKLVFLEIDEKTGYKVRAGIADKVPYLLIVGDREQQGGTVSVRSHDGGDEGAVPVETFLERICREIREKRLPADF